MKNISIVHYFQILAISPENSGDFTKQLESCYSQIAKLNIKKENIVKQVFFIQALNNEEYENCCGIVKSVSQEYFQNSIPTTIVSQRPKDYKLLMELMYIENSSEILLTRKKIEESDYIVCTKGGERLLISGAITYNLSNSDILKQSEKSFQIFKKILDTEGFQWSDIIRQWNYIENITGYSVIENREYQHYQIFNDIRSKYYKESDFVNGYPAATGIGAYSGGVIIDFLALKPSKEIKVLPVKNPLQVDAYSYSEKVLKTDHLKINSTERTPKFERAKLIQSINGASLFISGTAAIKGEDTLPGNKASFQTRSTLKIINKLVSSENLKRSGLTTLNNNIAFSYLRVYVKYSNDIPDVQKIIEEKFPLIPTIIIQADICRDNLEIEIEGVVKI